MNNNIQFILVLFSLIVGITSAVYFYQASEIFVNFLQKPLKLISSGMITISFGILIAVFISFYQTQGYPITLLNLPVSVLFFLMYIIGSLMILSGARQFSRKPASK
jgi:uncharacterized protein YacL